MDKKGKISPLVIIGAIALIAILGFMVYMLWGVKQQFIGEGGEGVISISGCPDTRLTSTTIKVQNPLNTTGNEIFNVTLLLYGNNGEIKTISSTSGDSTDLGCGVTYTGKVVSTDGSGGDSARIIDASGPSAKVTPEGWVTFTPTGSGATLSLSIYQRGPPEVRAKDVVNDGFCYKATGEGATDYVTTDGVVFQGTTNQTSIDVGSGGELHIIEYIRAHEIDENFNDLGTYILIDAATNVWDTPTVKVNGKVLSDVKDSLNSDEARAYNGYEYVYLIPKDTLITKNKEIAVDTSIFALGGVNPTGANNVSIDYAVIGQYQSTTNSDVIKVGAVKDDTSQTQVYTLFDTEVAVQ